MDASDPICSRCSKPVTPGTAAQYADGPGHMRCLAHETRLEAIEHQDTARRLVDCAKAAVRLAAERANTMLRQTHCPACGEPFALRRGLLFRGGRLVHADCWRDDPKPLDDSPTV
jgi:hypothetical protein